MAAENTGPEHILEADHVVAFDCPCAGCQALFHPSLEICLQRARQMKQRIPTSIRIEYEDGGIEGADGTDAFEILHWWRGCFTRGLNYES
jgi:hypothetical protein